MKFLDPYKDELYAIFRIMTAAMFGFHGIQKLFNVMMGGYSVPMFSLGWFAGLIELVGGILIIVGYQTRLAAFISSGTMAVAYIFFHWKFQFTQAFFPAANQGELAAVYCFAFLAIAALGAGKKWAIEKSKK